MADVTPKSGKTENEVIDLPRPSASGRNNAPSHEKTRQQYNNSISDQLARVPVRSQQGDTYTNRSSHVIGRMTNPTRLVHGSEYGATAPYPVTCCIGMSLTGAGRIAGGTRACAVEPRATQFPWDPLARRSGFCTPRRGLSSPIPYCNAANSSCLARSSLATKSVWASAGFIVERS